MRQRFSGILKIVSFKRPKPEASPKSPPKEGTFDRRGLVF